MSTLLQFDLNALHPSSASGGQSDPLTSPTAPPQWIPTFLAEMDQDRSHFFHLPAKSTWNEELARWQPELARRVPEVKSFLQLGIGGSSLGAEAIVRALGKTGGPTFHFLDNIDPDHLWNVLQQCDPNSTLVYVVTKSGTTLETVAQFLHIYEWLTSALGEAQARNHLVFCTDPKRGDLRTLGDAWKVPTFDIPPQLGGRFSALCAVGLLPALVAGISPQELLNGAADARSQFLTDSKTPKGSAVAELAKYLIHVYRTEKRNITVLMPYCHSLRVFGAWFTQLWAESLGKRGFGLTPVAAVGATDQHSILQLLRDGPQDKVVGFIEVAGFNKLLPLQWKSQPALKSFENVSGISLNQLMNAELNATRQVLTNNKRPHFSIVLSKIDAHAVGQLMFSLELLTALSGALLEIDPYDQPGVEEGKRLTLESLRALR